MPRALTVVSYPRRQRNRRLIRALESGAGAAVALLLAGLALSVGWTTVSLASLICAAALGWHSRHWLQLAERSAVGARSEQRVRAVLGALERDGWSVRHSLRWPGGGDVDHVAIAPSAVGVAFAIETKTRTHRPGDLARITAVAGWLERRHPRWCRDGAVPVLCLAGVHGIETWEAGVIVVSADRLPAVLSRLAGTTAKPRFLR